MPIPNEDQSIILDRLKKYLSIVSKKRPNLYHVEDIDNQNENLEAACSGLVTLWFYYIHRQKKEYFYNSIIAPILNWNEKKTTLSKALEEVIEYSFSSVMWLHATSTSFEKATSIQDNIQQSDCHLLINMIRQDDYPELRKEHEIAFVWKNKELIEFLKNLPPYKLIRLSSDTHAIGLFVDTTHYTLFDPNGFKISSKKHRFEKRFPLNKLEKLLAEIQKTFFYEPNSSVTGLTISVFDSVGNSLPAYINNAHKIQQILDTRLAAEGISHINAANASDNANALYFCAKKGHLDSVKLLLTRQANPAQITTYSYTSLHIAIQNGHYAVVKELLNSPLAITMLNIRLDEGESPLYIAVENNRTEIVHLLLEYGANAEQAAHNSFGPIHIAAQEGFFDIVQLLLDSSAGDKLLDAPVKDGRTALVIAAQNGHIEIVKLLLRYNSKTKLPNDWPTTLKLFKATTSEQYQALEQATNEIAKTQDIDNNNLIKIRMAYLLVESKIKALDLEIRALSESELLLPQYKIEKLNTIKQIVERLQTFVYFKTYNLITQDKTKRDNLVSENEKTFNNLFNKIEMGKTSAKPPKTTHSLSESLVQSSKKRMRI